VANEPNGHVPAHPSEPDHSDLQVASPLAGFVPPIVLRD
jgi:hypothetical protein